MCFHSPPQNSKHVPGEQGLGTNPAKCWVNVEQLSQMCPNSDFKTWPNLDLRCVPKLRLQDVSKLRLQDMCPNSDSKSVSKFRLQDVSKLMTSTGVQIQTVRGIQIQTSRHSNSDFQDLSKFGLPDVSKSRLQGVPKPWLQNVSKLKSTGCVKAGSWNVWVYHRDNHTSQTHSWTHTHMHVSSKVCQLHKCQTDSYSRCQRLYLSLSSLAEGLVRSMADRTSCVRIVSSFIWSSSPENTNENVFSTWHRPNADE